jgi:hypothetical protein
MPSHIAYFPLLSKGKTWHPFYFLVWVFSFALCDLGMNPFVPFPDGALYLVRSLSLSPGFIECDTF